MKLISRRIQRRYMFVFVRYARTHGNEYTPFNKPDFAPLRRRKDFDAVVAFLGASGFLRITPAYGGGPAGFRLTDAGLRFFEDSQAVASERRWTRGLAIAGLAISLAALLLAALSLYLQYPQLLRLLKLSG